MSGRVLVVDDEREMCEAIAAGLGPRGFEVQWHTSAEAALAALDTAEVDVVLTDLNMRGMDGLALCERVVASRPDVPVVVITAFGSLETAIAAIRAGAYDFITKPVKMEALAVALARAVQHRSLREEVKRLRRLVGEAGRFDELVGDSGAIRASGSCSNGSSTRTRACSSPARAAPGRRSSPGSSTATGAGRTARSSPSTARRCRSSSSRASSSAMRAVPSRTRAPRAPAFSSRRTAARSSSTRSRTYRSPSSRSSSARSRNGS